MNPWEKRAVPAFHLGLLLVAALVLIPFVWIIAAAFKSQISLLLGEVFFTPTLASFREVLFSRSTEFMSNTFNSLVVAAGSTLVILVAATLGGYAIERLGTPRWAVHTMLGWAVVFHMVPPITLVAAWFPLYREIGLDNTYLGLVLAHVAVHLPMALWLMTNFVRDVPIELEEAARIDGCSTPFLIWRIVVPLVAPGLAATAILMFIFSWNEFAVALNLTAKQTATIPVAIAKFAQGYEIKYGEMAATAALSLVPALAFLLFGQRYIVKGLTAGAVK
ncbi:MAG: carbohydrate ABC transporter permease [Telmatospirillum sp.]|jgi:multiple sugar transport system permease protein|nr:carbohydrate ABC transporter permease [Telmatospirillum sp.]MCZ8309479.1 carbohydrate ABC transporter permease [Magnetospirillum sp.]